MRLAVILPHRDREVYKEFQKTYLPDYLSKQKIEHKIFFCEQSQEGLFNRAKSINYAVKFALTDYNPDYIIIGDVDMVPIKVDYSYKAPSSVWFINAGGVRVLTSEFILTNGYNNNFEGWGYEDSEFMHRLALVGVQIEDWKLSNPDAEIVDLELRNNDTKLHSISYFGISNPPRFYAPNEVLATKHVDVLYPKTWLFPSQKLNNANLCDSIKKKPKEEAIEYFKENGMDQIDMSKLVVVSSTGTIAELYWE